jgi:predicted hydrolase (HD superfamily)
VTRTGLALARLSKKEWGDTIDLATLVPTLILHDVDKPLLFGRKNGKVEPLPLCRELSHGVVGAMILKELGFAHPIVSAVANHAASAPFHGGTVEAYVLHYADFFVSDHVLRNAGLEPFYQKHGR